MSMMQRPKVKEAQVIQTCRRIVEARAFEEFQGQEIDLFSASVVLSVYEGLSKKNQVRLTSMPIGQLIHIAYAVSERSRTKGKPDP